MYKPYTEYTTEELKHVVAQEQARLDKWSDKREAQPGTAGPVFRYAGRYQPQR